MANIFISYARDDDAPFVKKLYGDLIAEGFAVWWDKEAMDSRGRTFLQELRDAIAEVDRLILVIGPKAVSSDYVRAEWKFAREVCVVVNPILRLGEENQDKDYQLIPKELANLHCVDFRERQPYDQALSELLRILEKPVPELGPLYQVISLPPHYLTRSQALASLQRKVLADTVEPVVITSSEQTSTLQGMAGLGKSVLAAAFARECDTRRSFGDGVIWLTFGQQPNTIAVMRQVGVVFADDLSLYIDVNTAAERIGDLLRNKICLLILDDVWALRHVEAIINVLGPLCRVLLTTRDRSLARSISTQQFSLDLLSPEQALELLAQWSSQPIDALPEEAGELTYLCGYLPLALSVIGAMIRGLPDRWPNVLHRLRTASLKKLKSHLPNYPYPSVFLAIQVSVQALKPSEEARYLDFAVFPKGIPIPISTLQTLWESEGLDEYDSAELIDLLADRSLIQRDVDGVLKLHDLYLDYVSIHHENLSLLHERLVKAYGTQCPNGWASGPDDGYFFQMLPFHLRQSGREMELYELLLNFEWIEAKLEFTDVVSLVADYGLFETKDINDQIRLIQMSLQLSAHVLVEDKNQLAGQLLGRLLSQPFHGKELGEMLSQAKKWRRAVWLRPLYGRLAAPFGPLQLTYANHSLPVEAVAVSPVGRLVLSVSWDEARIWNIDNGRTESSVSFEPARTRACTVTPDWKHVIFASGNVVRVRDVASGREVMTLEGHDDEVGALAVSIDGSLILSGSRDGTIIVWKRINGQKVGVFAGHESWVDALAITPDSRLVISGSLDETVKVWEIKSGRILTTFTKHDGPVSRVTITPDGQLVLSASTNVIRVWETSSGQELLQFTEHDGSVDVVAVSPDSRMVISSALETVKVWDIESGRELLSFVGHSMPCSAISVTPEGNKAITASWDRTVKVWDIENGLSVTEQTQHDGPIFSLAVSSDNQLAISGSTDSTVKVWEIASGYEVQSFNDHTDWVNAVVASPDGQLVLSASADGTVRAWQVESGKVASTFTGHREEVKAVTITPDGKLVLSASADKTVKVWNITGGEEILTFSRHEDEVNAVAVTPDGRLALSASNDGLVRVWEIESGSEQMSFDRHREQVYTVAITPNNQLALIGYGDGVMVGWDLIHNREVVKYAGFGGPVYDIKISLDGRLVITASGDEKLNVWEIATARKVATFNVDASLPSCAITPDMRTIIAGDYLGRIHFLHLEGYNGL